MYRDVPEPARGGYPSPRHVREFSRCCHSAATAPWHGRGRRGEQVRIYWTPCRKVRGLLQRAKWRARISTGFAVCLDKLRSPQISHRPIILSEDSPFLTPFCGRKSIKTHTCALPTESFVEQLFGVSLSTCCFDGTKPKLSLAFWSNSLFLFHKPSIFTLGRKRELIGKIDSPPALPARLTLRSTCISLFEYGGTVFNLYLTT